MTAHLEPLQQKIFNEIKARTKENDLSVPTRQANWWYYSRTSRVSNIASSVVVR